MLRTSLCSLVGAGLGFGLGFILVMLIPGRPSASDTGAVVVFLGGLLAVGGAIAGAVIGGAAELVQYLRRRDEAERDRKGS